MTLTLWFQQLPAPFDSLITQAFASGDRNVDLPDHGGFVDRLGLSRARWAEDPKARPFIRQLSAALGKDMFKDLPKKLRAL